MAVHPDDKKRRGTDQASRRRGALVTAITGDPERPKSLTKKRQRDLWDKKVRDLMHRGILLKGCEEALAIYVLALLDLEECMKKGTHTQAQINATRLMAAEFFDTPASQFGKTAAKDRKGNKFTANGQPPGQPPGQPR